MLTPDKEDYLGHRPPVIRRFVVIRNTRAEEESGRGEMVRATVVGRSAPTIAAALVATAMSLAVGGLVSLALVLLGLPAKGSLTLGASFATLGLVFTTTAALAAQLTATARAASGVLGAILALAFALRAFGDIGDGTLSWFSPLGWVQAARPFADERWWPLGIGVAISLALAIAAAALEATRDQGAGILNIRSGPATGSRVLSTPLGLVFRLQRGFLLAWSIGLLAGGMALGSLGGDVRQLIGNSEQARAVFAQAGGANLADSFFATFFVILALIVSGYTIRSALKLRDEEVAGRSDVVLTTATSRRRWFSTQLEVAAMGSVTALGLGGLGAGLVHGLATDDLAQIGRLAAAALSYVPAVWMFGGVAIAVIGVFPQATAAAWMALALSVLITIVGPLLEIPELISDISPFSHLPLLPAEELRAAPIAILLGAAAALAGLGIFAFSRRDIA